MPADVDALSLMKSGEFDDRLAAADDRFAEHASGGLGFHPLTEQR
jgi:hypothetical protein